VTAYRHLTYRAPPTLPRGRTWAYAPGRRRSPGPARPAPTVGERGRLSWPTTTAGADAESTGIHSHPDRTHTHHHQPQRTACPRFRQFRGPVPLFPHSHDRGERERPRRTARKPRTKRADQDRRETGPGTTDQAGGGPAHQAPGRASRPTDRRGDETAVGAGSFSIRHDRRPRSPTWRRRGGAAHSTGWRCIFASRRSQQRESLSLRHAPCWVGMLAVSCCPDELTEQLVLELHATRPSCG